MSTFKIQKVLSLTYIFTVWVLLSLDHKRSFNSQQLLNGRTHTFANITKKHYEHELPFRDNKLVLKSQELQVHKEKNL